MQTGFRAHVLEAVNCMELAEGMAILLTLRMSAAKLAKLTIMEGFREECMDHRLLAPLLVLGPGMGKGAPGPSLALLLLESSTHGPQPAVRKLLAMRILLKVCPPHVTRVTRANLSRVTSSLTSGILRKRLPR